MSAVPENPQINSRVYDFCVRAFRTTKNLLKLNIKLHQDGEGEADTVHQGNIFLFNHFARFETFIPQYLIKEATGAYCRSVAAAEFFEGDERFSQFLYSIGVVPNDLPNLFPFLARELLHGRKLIVFPEGGMVKDKRVIDHRGEYNVFSRTANERRKHHRGSAVIALALDAFKTALLHDYAAGSYGRVERWAEQLDFDNVELLMAQAVKPTVIVPSHITFYPIRVSDNILHQAARLFNRGINKRFAEELIIEGNLLFKETDMDIRFSQPIVAGDYWRWWEKRLLPNVVHRFESLNELFALQPKPGHWRGRIHAIGMKAKSSKLRDAYMHSMYEAVTINLSHIASLIVLRLFHQGLRRINCGRFHKMLYLGIKLLQQSSYVLHRSLRNPEEYGAIINKGSSRLEQFLKTAQNLQLLHVDQSDYVLDRKLIHDFEIDEVRTENLISVYANEISPLSKVTRIIENAMKRANRVDARALADYRFDDQLLAFEWDRDKFRRERYREINAQQTQTADANWYFLKSKNKSADAVLLIHGFLSSPAELRSLGERLHAAGFHVLGVRLKGHGTSPWDLRSRSWRDWAASVERGYDILKAYSQSVHLIGFSTGGLLALNHAASFPNRRTKSVISVSAPVHFRNKNMIFVPLLHHANRLVSWVTSEGLVPFRPNEPENPEVNYQHIPIRALYQLQQLIEHLTEDSVDIHANVHLFQGDRDPVVDPQSVTTLEKLIKAETKTVTMIDSDQHGIVYRNIGDVQRKICASIQESV
ncbi:MAG: putative membrane protein [Olavius algarvensis Gamma 3 endosymbiont]|nr:MAG: putative membrane protein [Olavius algarvensis Gamma 3 endosymbiont]